MPWADIYGRLIAGTGWTFDYVKRSLTIPEAWTLFEYWGNCPPVNESVADLLASLVQRKGGQPVQQGRYRQTLAKGINPDELDPRAKPLPNYKAGSSEQAARAFGVWATNTGNPGAFGRGAFPVLRPQ